MAASKDVPRWITPIDRYVGTRIRKRRWALGYSQSDVARIIGVTYQQIQKYECGANRISAGRLYIIAKALGVPVSFFFDDMDPDMAASSRVPLPPNDREAPKTRAEVIFMQHYRSLPQKRRDALRALVLALADER